MIAPSISNNCAVSRRIRAICLLSMPGIILWSAAIYRRFSPNTPHPPIHLLRATVFVVLGSVLLSTLNTFGEGISTIGSSRPVGWVDGFALHPYTLSLLYSSLKTKPAKSSHSPPVNDFNSIYTFRPVWSHSTLEALSVPARFRIRPDPLPATSGNHPRQSPNNVRTRRARLPSR